MGHNPLGKVGVTARQVFGVQFPVQQFHGSQLFARRWLYTALRRVVENGRPGEVYNIGGTEVPNIVLMKKILQVSGKPESLITCVVDRPGHDRRYAINPGEIQAELGWKSAC